MILHQVYLHRVWYLAKHIQKVCSKTIHVGSAFIKSSPGMDIWGQNSTGKEKHVKFPKAKDYVTNERIKFQGLYSKAAVR